MTRLNGRRFVVASTATNTFALTGEDSTSYDTYSSGGTASKTYEIATTYTSAMNCSELQFTQSADVMYIVHPESLPPSKIIKNRSHIMVFSMMLLLLMAHI